MLFRSQEVHCDVLIIGAGIVGAWTAYFFVKHWRDCKIRVIEQSTVGGGASSVSAGFDAVESADPVQRNLACRSRRLYREISEAVPAAAVEKVITIWIVDDGEADAFTGRFDDGLSAGRLRRIGPFGGPEGFIVPPGSVGFEDHESGFARPGEISRALFAHLVACHSNISVYEGTRAVEVTSDEEASCCTTIDGRRIYAGVTVLATGAHPRLDGARHGTVRRLRRKKVASLLVNSMPPATATAVVYQSAGCFFLPVVARRHWVFGFSVESWDIPWSGVPTLTAEERAAGLALLSSYRPDFVDLAQASQVAFDLYSDNRRPKAVAINSHVWFLGGFSGGGYRWAPAFVEDFVRRISTNGQSPKQGGAPCPAAPTS